MEQISRSDRQILRELAQKHLDYANSPENEAILRKWAALENGRRETPTVRLLFSNFPHEVITPRLRCEGEKPRRVEAKLLSALVVALFLALPYWKGKLYTMRRGGHRHA